MNYIKSLEVRKKHRDFVKRQHGNGSHASRNSFLEKEAYTQVIQEAMSELCDKCQKVLVLKYFEGKSMDEIAAAMNLKNRDVAKSKRYECFNKLQKIVKKRYSKDELF